MPRWMRIFQLGKSLDYNVGRILKNVYTLNLLNAGVYIVIQFFFHSV